jgi:hypothetical protein
VNEWLPSLPAHLAKTLPLPSMLTANVKWYTVNPSSRFQQGMWGDKKSFRFTDLMKEIYKLESDNEA